MNVVLKIVVFIALLAIIVLAATSLLKEREQETVPPRYYTVKRIAIERAVFGSGMLRCSRRAEIVSRVAGKIQDVFVREGDTVRSSQTLCKMTNDQVENEFTIAQKDFRLANEEYQDKEKSHALGGSPSKSELERLKWELEKQEKALALKEEKLKNLTLTSPLDGTVLKSHLKKEDIALDPDKTYPEGTPLFVVGDLTSLAVYGTILQSDRQKVEVGQAALTFCGSKGWLPGKVSWLSRISEEGRYGITIDFDKPPSGLNEGLTVNFQIIFEKKSDVLAVPVEFVDVQNGRHWVKQVVGEEVRRIPIEVGISNHEFYEVTQGLKEGDKVRWDASEKQ